jgi:hypothetical protein
MSATAQPEATQQSEEIQMAIAYTQTAAQAYTQLVEPTHTFVPTNTPIIAQPTVTFSPTPEFYTATVAAGFTQGASSTITSVPSETPNSAAATIAAAFTQLAESTSTVVVTTTPLPTSDSEISSPATQTTGRLEITYPLEMILDESDAVTVEIIVDPEYAAIGAQPVFGTGVISVQVKSEGEERGRIEDTIKIYPLMSAELIATNFNILTDTTENRRTVLIGQPAVWSWNIAPKKTGRQIITINIFGETAVGAEISLIKTKSQSITVIDKSVQLRILDRLVNNWDTILISVASTGGPLGLLLAYLNYKANKLENDMKGRVKSLENRLSSLQKED